MTKVETVNDIVKQICSVFNLEIDKYTGAIYYNEHFQ